MIHLYTWNTPNGIKPLLMLEELGVDYEAHPIDISGDRQKSAAFLTVNPNGRIPAMIDTDRPGDAMIDGTNGHRVFESGAILLYLAQRSGRFLPTAPSMLSEALGWMFWQAGGTGPMVGQLHWFRKNAEGDEVAIDRYVKESSRLLDVLDRRLAEHEYLAGEYGVADMMNWAWAKSGVDGVGGDRPALRDWIDRIGSRPAVERAQRIADGLKKRVMTDRAKD